MSPHSGFFEKRPVVKTRWVNLLKDTEMQQTVTENIHRDAFEIHWTRNWPSSYWPRNLIFPRKTSVFWNLSHGHSMDDACKSRSLIIWSNEKLIQSNHENIKHTSKIIKKRRSRTITENAKTLILLGEHESSQRFFLKNAMWWLSDMRWVNDTWWVYDVWWVNGMWSVDGV